MVAVFHDFVAVFHDFNEKEMSTARCEAPGAVKAALRVQLPLPSRFAYWILANVGLTIAARASMRPEADRCSVSATMRPHHPTDEARDDGCGKRDGELVADLVSKCTGLGKREVVRIRRYSPTH
jgi:hypothetical protein